MPKNVYFVRHGECVANVKGVIAGGADDSPLTDVGRQQAAQTAASLAGIKFDLVISSPLSRAKDTALIIGGTLGFDVDKIIIQQQFSEKDVGEFTGKPKEDYFTFELAGGEAGETTEEMQQRVREGLEWLKAQDFRNALVVSHNGTIRMIRTVLENLPAKHFAHLSQLHNGEYYQIELK